jgi:hypothetical protein
LPAEQLDSQAGLPPHSPIWGGSGFWLLRPSLCRRPMLD